jgi:hypothetical protein
VVVLLINTAETGSLSSGTALLNPGLSQMFRDGWQLCHGMQFKPIAPISWYAVQTYCPILWYAVQTHCTGGMPIAQFKPIPWYFLLCKRIPYCKVRTQPININTLDYAVSKYIIMYT